MKLLKTLTCLVFISLTNTVMAFEQSVLVFGDSLSASYNIATENGWVTLLEQKLRSSDKSVKFVNASISGETSSGGLVRFEQQVNKTKPTVVILELGANDGLRGFNLTTTRNNLTQMIEISEAQGAKVLLAGIHIPPNYGRTYTRKFDQIFTDLAKREQVSLIPFILEGVATLPALMQNDGLHPNEKGQLVIVDTVHKYLLPML